MNKKTKNVIIALIVIILALGCGSVGLVAADRHIESVESTTLSDNSTQKSRETTDSQSVDDKSENANGGNNFDSNEDNSATVTKNQNSADNKTKSNSVGSNNSGNSGGSSKSNGKASPTTTKPKQTTPAVKKTYTCTVSIDCSVILSNKDNLTDGKEAYVPSSGYILKNYTIKAQEGESVYSVFERVCKENGIPYTAEDTGFGKYVSSINNLAEKDCGSGSGWIYTVNGRFINRTCEKEKIKSNSTIIWEYVV